MELVSRELVTCTTRQVTFRCYNPVQKNLLDNLIYSTLKRGRGGIDRMQCNFIEAQIIAECLNHFARDCR